MRTGVFGGSFSPVHNGHVAAAERFAEQCALDRLLIVPTGNHPVKDSGISAADRLELCRLSFETVEKAEVSDIEIARPGVSYTYDTLKLLAETGGEDFYLLCGSDMILRIIQWYRGPDVLKMCTLVHAGRYEDSSARDRTEQAIRYLRKEYGAKITELEGSITELSSSGIREKIARGEDVSGLLPQKEYRFIQKKGLFL